MTEKSSWVRLLAESDAVGLWEKLYRLVTHHNAVKSFINAHGVSGYWTQDGYLDITQDLFARLLEKGRWQYYLDAGYADETIEHELQHLELPNLIGMKLSQRHPEAFRIARRVSNLLKTSPQFKYYGSPAGRSQSSGKLVSRVYGLACWFSSVTMKEESGLADLIKTVAFRNRETRRSGRGKSSQLIISNKALCQLLVDIFKATQSLMDVRTVRLLALSKIAVEDSRFVSIDAEIVPQRSTQSRPYRIDLADKRPTPEQNLLDREAAGELDRFAENVISGLKHRVRNKPRRFSKLVRVVWYSYFDPVPRSQIEVAALIGMSYSLVHQYRKLFDSYVKKIDLPAEQWVILNRSIEIKLASIMSALGPARVQVNQDHGLHGRVGAQRVRATVSAARGGNA